MKVDITDKAKCQKTLQIEVPAQVIIAEFEQVYAEIRKTAQIPGFRKGKAPQDVLEQHFSAKANEEVLNNLVNNTYRQAVADNKLKPVASPQISDIDFKQEEKLSFTATVDVRPEYELKDYKGLKIKKSSTTVGPEEVDRVLEAIREQNANFSPVEDRPAKIGDYIISDYSYSVEEKTVEEKSNAWLWLDEKIFNGELGRQMAGVKPGEEREFDLELPEKFSPEELAKKTAHFKIRVKEIKEKKLSELDDDLARRVGKDSLAELREQIVSELGEEKKNRVRQEMKDQVVDALVKMMPVDVPETMREQRERLLRENAKNRLSQQGLKPEQAQAETETLKPMIEQEALKQLRSFFILEDIGEKEAIEVKEEELLQRLDRIGVSSNQNREQVLKYFQENNMLENLHWDIWENKIIDFLLANAQIEEVEGKSASEPEADKQTVNKEEQL